MNEQRELWSITLELMMNAHIDGIRNYYKLLDKIAKFMYEKFSIYPFYQHPIADISFIFEENTELWKTELWITTNIFSEESDKSMMTLTFFNIADDGIIGTMEIYDTKSENPQIGNIQTKNDTILNYFNELKEYIKRK